MTKLILATGSVATVSGVNTYAISNNDITTWVSLAIAIISGLTTIATALILAYRKIKGMLFNQDEADKAASKSISKMNKRGYKPTEQDYYDQVQRECVKNKVPFDRAKAKREWEAKYNKENKKDVKKDNSKA